ncbi:MAG: hypothetical protein ACYTAS_22900, partial [Planctomycetota bacterium]
MRRGYVQTAVKLTLLTFVFLSINTSASADLLVDQEHDVPTVVAAGCGGGVGGSLFQSFTPTASTLDAVRLNLRAASNSPGGDLTTTITIRSGAFDGTELGTATALVAVTNTAEQVDFDISPPLALTPGDTYVIELSLPVGLDPSLSWMVDLSAGYPGGISASDCGFIASDPTRDFIFATYTDATLAVPGLACVHFAGQSTVPPLVAGWPESEVSIPPSVPVCGGGRLSISAGGLWSHTPWPETGPDGKVGNATTLQEYIALGGISDVLAPLNMLVGVFLTDDAPDPGATPPSLTLGMDTMTAPELQQTFAIGSELSDIEIPLGATRLFLGLKDGWEWSNNTGKVFVDVSLNCPICIDIKPGSWPNAINQGSNGLIPIAIFSSPEFDATQVDPTTVSLAGA